MFGENFKLWQSRFFVSAKNLDAAIKRVQNVEHEGWLAGSSQKIYNPLVRPTPFNGVKSLLEFVGFTTHESEDGSIWIKDFDNERDMTTFEVRNIVKILLLLSKDETDSFLLAYSGQVSLFIKDGSKLDEYESDHSHYLETAKVGKSPWFPLNMTPPFERAV